MCGIFGYAGRITKNQTTAYRLLSEIAIASEVRGIDATGFSCRLSLTGEVISDKMPIKASKFVQTSGDFRSLVKQMPDTFIGHTRLGTGSSPKINNNNHPFFGSRFNMVHNGVIPSWRNLRDKHELSMQSETDSEVVLRSFEKRIKDGMGPVGASEWVLDNIWGNMAIALLDKDFPTIWLFRNENPIVVFEIPKDVFGNAITIFCSTTKIFDKAWKKVFFSQKPPPVISLLDHKSYRLTIDSDSSKFINLDEYEIDVKDKFSRVRQYSNWRDFDDYTSYRNNVDNKSKKKSFTTKVANCSKPELGTVISIVAAREIQKLCLSESGRKSVTIDGMGVDEFSTARSIALIVSGLDKELLGAIQDN